MNGHQTQRELAYLVQDFRQRAGLTQDELAARARISLGGLRDIEQQRVVRPRGGTLRRLAAALDLSPVERQELLRVGRQGPVLAQDLRLQILGPLSVLVDGAPVELRSERQRTLLGLLALSPGVPVRGDALVDAIWGAQPPRTIVELVRTQVSRLRQRIQPKGTASSVLIATGGGYELRVNDDQLDILAFGRLVEYARRECAAGRLESAIGFYQQALGLWRGEPLADLPGLHMHTARAALVRQLETVLLEYADVAARVGRYEQLLTPLHRFVEANPLHESAHARLMTALAGVGQRAVALELFETLRRRLADELGVDPGAEVQTTHQGILRGVSSWGTPCVGPVAAVGAGMP
ncbi:BTAD domain-containing putative transcriptional regulator [Streptomyces sp. CB03238]|uniref:BTAD domain-containing putative transcriptional regulator n=1 Tax=Streptomyces sp. CB03238 TaxID=1907777 RepID=UPI0015C4D746|nr:BTAD domain-containing putative transcriptional regulator [Streptomyces sp. CB03238]